MPTDSSPVLQESSDPFSFRRGEFPPENGTVLTELKFVRRYPPSFEGTFPKRATMKSSSWVSLVITTLFLYPAIADQLDHWTLRPIPSPRPQLYGVAFCNDRFIAVGDKALLVSSNGSDWEMRETGTDTLIHDVAYGKGRYVAVSEQTVQFLSHFGKILTSTDTRQWEILDASPHHLSAITFAQDQFIAVGHHRIIDNQRYQFRGSVFISGNGTNWQYQDVDLPGFLTGIVFAHGRYVATGSYAWGEGFILSSTDSATWETNVVGLSTMTALATGNGRIIAVGYGATIMVSDDAVHWTRQGNPNNFPSTIAFGNGIFFAGGADIVGGILSSEDGTNWVSRTMPKDSCPRGIAYGKKTFVTVNNLGNIFQSSDFGIPFLQARRVDKQVELAVTGEVGAVHHLEGNGTFSGWRPLVSVTNTAATMTFSLAPTNGSDFFRAYR